MKFKIFLIVFAIFFTLCFAGEKHDFLVEKYDAMHHSKVQEKYKTLHPMPAGVVYIQNIDHGEKEMRQHFRLMKKLGYTSLKQIMVLETWTHEDIQLIALDEGIIPWWYGDAGWEPITDDLLKELKISSKLSVSEIRNHSKMQAYQKEVLRKRILRLKEYREQNGTVPRGSQTAYDPTVGGRGLDLNEKGKAIFKDWVKSYYGDVETLNHAWCLHHAGLGKTFDSWDDFYQNMESKTAHRNYRNKMDVFRFKAMHGCENIRDRASSFQAFDSNQPFRAGGEMGLFLPAAYMGVDMERIAEVAKDYGSFYPSTHLSWHFDQTHNEIVRPLYIQASLMNDWFKGGWTGGWESTGGPQQFDGEKSSSSLNAYYVNEGTITQFYLSQMAAGFKGFGIWCWNARTAGKEGGEYSLLDRNNQITPRAIRLGKIAQAMEKYRDEIWKSHKEPLVGVYIDWNNDAAWGAMSVQGRDYFRMIPIEARIGVTRALINANIPFEFVTPDDLKKGLAPRYRIIYMPSIISFDTDVLNILDQYVHTGGRLVIDLPGGKFDQYTALLPTGKKSQFAKIFGATLDNFQFSGSNKTIRLFDQEWTGLIADMTPLSAKIEAEYNHGKPAILQNRYGQGESVIMGLDMAYQCFMPGNDFAEEILVKYTLGDYQSPYTCEDAIVYRLAGPDADHYYFMNDGEERMVQFSSEFSYSKVVDAVSGEKVDLGKIHLPADDARWIRMGKISD